MKFRPSVSAALFITLLAALVIVFVTLKPVSKDLNNTQIPSEERTPNSPAKSKVRANPETKVDISGGISATARKGADQSDEHLDSLESMPKPPAPGQLSSGPMAADSAMGGVVAYAVAKTSSSRVDLKPDQNGTFQRMLATPNQSIDFTVRYQGLKSGTEIYVGVLDGGESNVTTPLTPDKDGKVKFNFVTGPYDGSYRISLTTSDHDVKMMDVWVGKPEWEDPVTVR